MAGEADFLSDLAATGSQAPAHPDEASFLADLAQAAQAAQTTQTAPAAQPDYSAKGWANFIANEGTRVGATALAGVPLMAMNAGVASRNILGDAYNKAVGNPATPDYELPGKTFEDILDAHTTAPQSLLGKAAEFLGTSVLSGKLPMPEVGNVPKNFAPAAAKAASNL